MTPYECTFGVKCNKFEQWNEVDIELAIQNRAEQIRKLFEKHDEVKTTIEKAQEKQMDKQNERTKRIKRTFLENGTVVYRKNDGIITKQEPRWIGLRS